LVGEAELVGELINRQHRAERPTARATRVALSRSPPTGAVKRRTLVVIEATTSALLVVSLAVVWMLPTHATGLLVEARGVAFGIFTLSAWTLLVAVLIDFDRWVGTVRPVPKRLVRRFVARADPALAGAVCRSRDDTPSTRRRLGRPPPTALDRLRSIGQSRDRERD